MKAYKNLNVLVFVFIFGFSNVSHAGGTDRIIDLFKRFFKSADSTLDDAARKSEEAVDGVKGSKSAARKTNPNLVTENANDAKEVHLSDFIMKVTAKADVEGADVFSAQVARILMRKSKAAPITVADAGTGKSVNIQYLQHLINVKSPLVKNLHGKDIYLLNIYDLVGGTGLQGSLEERFGAILKEMAQPENANKIIVIDELENVLGSKLGKEFLESMKSYLTSDMNVKLIFNITPEPYDKLMKDPQLVRRMSPIYKKEPSIAVVRRILRNIRNSADIIDGVKISNEQIEQILALSKTHPTLKNPDVAITMINDAINNVIADRATGSLKIVKLESGLEDIQAEIDTILGMRQEGVSKAFGPFYDQKLIELRDKEKTIKGVVDSYNESFRVTETYRDLLLKKIDQRKKLYERLSLNKKNDNLGGEVNIETQIDDLSLEIQNLSEKIKDQDPLLVSSDLTEGHIVEAAAVILNKDERFVKLRINGPEAREVVVDRIAEKLAGRHKQAVNAIVRRELTQRRLGDNGGIPAFLILNKSSAEADQLAKTVVEDLTGASPYRIDSLEIKDRHSLNKHEGSDTGLIGSDVEGAIYKEARMTGGHIGVLFSGIQNAISDVLDLADRILSSRILTSNRGDRISFTRSTMFLTLSDFTELTVEQKAILNALPNETAQQNYLRKFVKEQYHGKAKPGEFSESATQMSDQLLDKLYVIYLDDASILDDHFKAILAETLKSKALKKAFEADDLLLNIDFEDSAIDYLFNVLRESGSNDINRVLVTEVMGFIDDLRQSKQIISGDRLIISVERNRLAAETLDWADGSRRAHAMKQSLSLQPGTLKPKTEEALEKALKLIED
jgi:ATP-dependent Clp protease ATP-binding subunit ClpA